MCFRKGPISPVLINHSEYNMKLSTNIISFCVSSRFFLTTNATFRTRSSATVTSWTPWVGRPVTWPTSVEQRTTRTLTTTARPSTVSFPVSTSPHCKGTPSPSCMSTIPARFPSRRTDTPVTGTVDVPLMSHVCYCRKGQRFAKEALCYVFLPYKNHFKWNHKYIVMGLEAFVIEFMMLNIYQ